MSEYDDDAQYNYRNYMAGRREERAAIVAWLSGQYRTANGYFTHVIAEALRNGEHLRATRTEPRDDELPPPSM